MTLTRQQFAEHWNSIRPTLGDPDSPLWAVERDINIQCQWFINIRPIVVHSELKTEDYPWGPKSYFYTWCEQNLQGNALCYSSDSDSIEWWGFTNYDDIAWFVLRWS